MFASLTAQKLAHDFDANLAFAKDVPEGVDVNLFEDAERFRRELEEARFDRAQARLARIAAQTQEINFVM